MIPHFFEYLEVAHFHVQQHCNEQQQQLQNENVSQNGDEVLLPCTSSFVPTISHTNSRIFTKELSTARRAASNHIGAERQKFDRVQIIPAIFYGLAKHVDGMMVVKKNLVKKILFLTQWFQFYLNDFS